MRNSIKAVSFVVIGIAIIIASLSGIVAMYLSPTFLPVYVGNTYVIGNQIVRYGLYIALFVVVILSVKLTAYGARFLIKKVHKKIRRR